jgi:hypothetical protein
MARTPDPSDTTALHNQPAKPPVILAALFSPQDSALPDGFRWAGMPRHEALQLLVLDGLEVERRLLSGERVQRRAVAVAELVTQRN